jgi:hypothetical protein
VIGNGQALVASSEGHAPSGGKAEVQDVGADFDLLTDGGLGLCVAQAPQQRIADHHFVRIIAGVRLPARN